MRKEWEVTEFERDRFDAIATLRENFEDQEAHTSRRSYGHEYFEWKLRRNPYKKGICKVIEVEGNPVGMATITPKRLKVDHQTVDGAEIGDTFTHEDFQRKGIFSAVVAGVRSASLKEGLNFIYGTPNKNSLPGYERKLDFAVIPSAKVFNVVYPLKTFDILKIKLKHRLIASLVSPIAFAVLAALRAVRRPKVDSSMYEFERINKFDQEVDKLWEKVEGQYDCILQRTQNYLNWRFVENPDVYRMFVARKEGEIIGYIVIKDGYWSDLKMGYIADIFCEDLSSFNFLIDRAIKIFKSENNAMVSCWLHDGELLSSLKRTGFLIFKDVPIICYKNKLGQSVLDKSLKWYFTISDSDNI